MTSYATKHYAAPTPIERRRYAAQRGRKNEVSFVPVLFCVQCNTRASAETIYRATVEAIEAYQFAPRADSRLVATLNTAGAYEHKRLEAFDYAFAAVERAVGFEIERRIDTANGIGALVVTVTAQPTQRDPIAGAREVKAR